jgi:hypothetical protein
MTRKSSLVEGRLAETILMAGVELFDIVNRE